MKQLLFFILLLSSLYIFPQKNIIDYLKLSESKIKAYSEGELMANDTIIDLENGYYAELQDDLILRQAKIFNNSDGSKLLAISICEWDFACFDCTSNFYNLSKSGDSTAIIEWHNILPEIKISNFVSETEIIKILNKYLVQLQGGYLDSNATIDDLLEELYEVKYILPQKGTTVKATLAICDYIPTNEIEINESDWGVLSNNFEMIKLNYNKKTKKFQTKNN